MIAAVAVHVAAGGVGILAGAAAMTVRKGGRLHRASGTVFCAAMLVMAAMATLLACTLPDWANLPGGVFSLYLVSSGWAAVRRHRTQARRVDYALLGLGCLATGLSLGLVWLAQTSATGLVGGKPMPLFAVFAGLCGLAVTLDIWMLLGRRMARVQLLRRHVWRMSTALFFGTGSFFLGQQKVMPGWVQGSPVLFVLALAPLVLMLVWLFRAKPMANRLSAAAG